MSSGGGGSIVPKSYLTEVLEDRKQVSFKFDNCSVAYFITCTGKFLCERYSWNNNHKI